MEPTTQIQNQTNQIPSIPPVQPLSQPTITQSPQPKTHKLLVPLLIVILLLIISLLVYLLARNTTISTDTTTAPAISTTPTSTPQPSITQTETKATPTGWKTYTDTKGIYSIDFPANWFVYEYDDGSNNIAVSDVSNPSDIPANISPEGHTLIQVSFSQGTMPTSFPYTNGASTNTTIKPFTINSYAGIRGSQESTIGLGESVYLKHPQTGYIGFDKQIDDLSRFDQILSTFKFSAQPSTSIPSSWKTYSNQAFTMKLPIQYDYDPRYSNNPSFTMHFTWGEPKNATPVKTTDMTIGYSQGDPTLMSCKTNEECYQGFVKVYSVSGYNSISTMINGKQIKGFETSRKDSNSLQYQNIYPISHNGKLFVYDIQISAPDIEQARQLVPQVNQILSTFQFTN